MALSPIAETAVTAAETESATLVQTIAPSKTYSLDFSNGYIGGMVDGIEALKQFILKAIRTARGRFLIYDDDYGSELEDVLGGDSSFELLAAEIPRAITEALIYDDRISAVDDFVITQEGDAVYVEFTVTSVLGAFGMEVTL